MGDTMRFTEKEARKLLSVYRCPKCDQKELCVYFSVCYDNDCCGILDRIMCEAQDCYFEREGMFQDLEDYIEVLLSLDE